MKQKIMVMVASLDVVVVLAIEKNLSSGYSKVFRSNVMKRNLSLSANQ